MNCIQTEIPGVLIIEPKVFGDARGYFKETFSAQRYRDAGITESFVQDNISFSLQGVLRGLHYQNPNGQGKLVEVFDGEVFDVAVDIRVGSPTFGKWAGAMISSQNHRQFYIPAGFAHGFCVLSQTAVFHYKCTQYYMPANEGGIAWNDPDIGIVWPISNPVLSAKDLAHGKLCDIAHAKLPVYAGAGK